MLVSYRIPSRYSLLTYAGGRKGPNKPSQGARNNTSASQELSTAEACSGNPCSQYQTTPLTQLPSRTAIKQSSVFTFSMYATRFNKQHQAKFRPSKVVEEYKSQTVRGWFEQTLGCQGRWSFCVIPPLWPLVRVLERCDCS